MKKIYIYNIIIAISILVLVSCNDYLDKLPDNRTNLADEESISQLLVSAYPSACYMAFCEAMSDNAGDKGNAGYYSSENEDAYFWNEKFSSDDYDTPEYYWNKSYEAISACNIVLKAIEDQGSKEEAMPYKGEALLARAYAHFMLVNIFSQTYNPNTSKEDLGIPYVTEVEEVVEKEYKRESVERVYELIKKDLEEGLPLIKDDAYNVPKFHFNILAANAFASRFYLYTANWDKVIEHANKVLTSEVSSLIRPWLSVYNSLTYNELIARYTHHEENANLILAGQETAWTRDVARARYSLSFSKSNEIFENNILGKEWTYGIYGGEFYANVPKMKEHFKYTSINSTTGYIYLMSPLFTVEEVLLNRAEAYAMLNMTDETIFDINTFLINRIKEFDISSDVADLERVKNYYTSGVGNNLNPFYTLTEDQLSLVKCITDFRRVEFVHEGLRWFDVRRFQIEVEHNVVEGESIILKGNDKRRECQIPEISIELGLLPNPRE